MKVKDFITVLQNYIDSDADVTINGERNIIISYDKNTVDITNKKEILTFEDNFEESTNEVDRENI